MIVTKMAIAAGIALVGLLCWLAAMGLAVADELLVTVGALVLLVAGGNWLNARSGGPARPGRGRPGAGYGGGRRGGDPPPPVP